jgi:cyclopropane-fatty-acyl-phospholipid synthase
MSRLLRTDVGDERATTLEILDELFNGYYPRDFAVRLWDDTTREPDAGQPARFTLVIADPGALRRAVSGSESLELGLSRAYLAGDLDVEGDLEAIFPLVQHILEERNLTRRDKLRLARRVRTLPQPSENGSPAPVKLHGSRLSLRRARTAISYHYDLPAEFYAVFLDRRMTYSCAYYASEDEDLDRAQERKLELVCRKLRLKPGERLLDVGCGWGSLVLYATERYGVDAVGITLSDVQAATVRKRAETAGLAERVDVRVLDYRELDERERFDKVASVGMVEHVTEDGLVDFFERIHRFLRPGGVFLLHGCGQPVDIPRGRPSFSSSYVLPNTEVVPISTTLTAAETAGWEVRDVEGFRESYVLMAREWRRRLEANEKQIRELVGDVIYRAWRLGAAGVAYRHRVGRLGVYHTLLAKPSNGGSGLPLTREDWYR